MSLTPARVAFAVVATMTYCGVALFAVAAQSASVPREILALYDGEREPAPTDTRIHRYAEMPLNHLGYVVRYHDVRKRLPAPVRASRYAGVMTWFGEPLKERNRYLKWAVDMARSGTRFIVLGEVGGDVWSRDLHLTNQLLAAIGLRHEGQSVTLTHGTRVVHKDRNMVEFERTLDPVLPYYPVVHAIDPETQVFLQLATQRSAKDITSAVVAIGPGGGFAATNYEWFYEPDSQRVKWLINPFAFFHGALGGLDFPIPDVTTVSGRRLFFSHIDGVGLNNIAQIEEYRKPPTLVSKVMLQELIEPFPDLPVSFSLVAGDLDPDVGGNATAVEVVQRIFALSQVEVASHSYTHPFRWDFFESYDRAKEERLIENNAPSSPDINLKNLWRRVSAARGEVGAKKLEKYIAWSSDMPRSYLRYPFDVAVEVERARAATEELAPAGKPVMLYQWSGDALPFEAMIGATRQAGLRNINGGGTRFDIAHPSVGYIAPIARTVGVERQIYAVNSSESYYTNYWRGPLHGFRGLKHTLENTETPRRLKGVNVYYHIYSAQERASLDAVKFHLETARQAPLAPIATSRYTAIADSFFDVEVVELGERRWAIENRGALQTVRFDRAAALAVDLQASRGVIGQNRHQGSLYVALDASVKTPVVVLTGIASPGSADRPALPWMVESRWLVEGLERKVCGASFQAQGFGNGEFVWKGLAPGNYRITAARAEQQLWGGDATADVGGQLVFTIPLRAIEPIALEIACLPQDAEESS